MNKLCLDNGGVVSKLLKSVNSATVHARASITATGAASIKSESMELVLGSDCVSIVVEGATVKLSWAELDSIRLRLQMVKLEEAVERQSYVAGELVGIVKAF